MNSDVPQIQASEARAILDAARLGQRGVQGLLDGLARPRGSAYRIDLRALRDDDALA